MKNYCIWSLNNSDPQTFSCCTLPPYQQWNLFATPYPRELWSGAQPELEAELQLGARGLGWCWSGAGGRGGLGGAASLPPLGAGLDPTEPPERSAGGGHSPQFADLCFITRLTQWLTLTLKIRKIFVVSQSILFIHIISPSLADSILVLRKVATSIIFLFTSRKLISMKVRFFILMCKIVAH